MTTIQEIESSVHQLSLTENYRPKGYVKNFNQHVDDLITTCVNLTGDNFDEDKNFHFTDSVYWSCEAIILEKLDDIDDNSFLNALDNLEDQLYSTLKRKIKTIKSYTDQSLINKMLDLTVNNILLSLKFDKFSDASLFENPWMETTKILLENGLIYTFSNDINSLKDLGLKINENESELIKKNLVGVVGKGNQDKFATGYFRDLAYLRNLLYDLLESENHTSSKPIKADSIIDQIRQVGIGSKELSDNNIRSWIITPLKKSNRLGSNNEGFFIIKTEEDLIASYERHLESFKGFYRTLENHKRLADKFNISSDRLDKHNYFPNIFEE